MLTTHFGETDRLHGTHPYLTTSRPRPRALPLGGEMLPISLGGPIENARLLPISETEDVEAPAYNCLLWGPTLAFCGAPTVKDRSAHPFKLPLPSGSRGLLTRQTTRPCSCIQALELVSRYHRHLQHLGTYGRWACLDLSHHASQLRRDRTRVAAGSKPYTGYNRERYEQPPPPFHYR